MSVSAAGSVQFQDAAAKSEAANMQQEEDLGIAAQGKSATRVSKRRKEAAEPLAKKPSEDTTVNRPTGDDDDNAPAVKRWRVAADQRGDTSAAPSGTAAAAPVPVSTDNEMQPLDAAEAEAAIRAGKQMALATEARLAELTKVVQGDVRALTRGFELAEAATVKAAADRQKLMQLQEEAALAGQEAAKQRRRAEDTEAYLTKARQEVLDQESLVKKSSDRIKELEDKATKLAEAESQLAEARAAAAAAAEATKKAEEEAAARLTDERNAQAAKLKETEAKLTDAKKAAAEAKAAAKQAEEEAAKRVEASKLKAVEEQLAEAHTLLEKRKAMESQGGAEDSAQAARLLELEVQLSEARSAEKEARAAAERAARDAADQAAKMAAAEKAEGKTPEDEEQADTEDKKDDAKPDTPSYDAANPGPWLAARAPQRFFVSCRALGEQLAGEYRLHTGTFKDRPVFQRRKVKGTEAMFLYWGGSGFRCTWRFGTSLPEGGADEKLVATSQQAAWTVLPDELASQRWDTAKDSGIVEVTIIRI